MFSYEEFLVNGVLNLFIKKLWSLNNLQNPDQITQKSILPNGCFTLAFIEGNGLSIEIGSEVAHYKEGVYFCGQLTKVIKVDVLPFTKAIMVQLFPWTPVHFTSLNMALYVNRLVPVEDLNLKIQLRSTPILNISYLSILKFTWLNFAPLFKTNRSSDFITGSCKMLISSDHDQILKELCTRQGCSQRQLQKKFKRHLGLGPKEFSIIIKLRKAIDDLAFTENSTQTLTRLAISNHFYDQAHFNHTFQSIVKTSPKKFNAPDFLLSFKK